MLRWRLTLGLTIIVLLVAMLWLDHVASTAGNWPPGVVLLPLALVLAVLASHEVIGLLDARGRRPIRWVVYAGNVALISSSLVPFWVSPSADRFAWPLAVMTLVLMVVFCLEIWRYEGSGESAERLGATVFCVAYVGLLLGFVVQMRTLGDGRLGVVAIASLVLVVKASDTGAYTAGRLFGRRKLAPRVSPGKTLEGLVGGVALALFASWLSLRVVPSLLLDREFRAVGSSADWIAFGLLVAAAGVLGDLAESLLKRDAGRKDSSDWLPGLGGILDMLDSVLMAAPVAYWFWMYRLVGP